MPLYLIDFVFLLFDPITLEVIDNGYHGFLLCLGGLRFEILQELSQGKPALQFVVLVARAVFAVNQVTRALHEVIPVIPITKVRFLFVSLWTQPRER